MVRGIKGGMIGMVKEEGEEEFMYVCGGIVEVEGGKVRVVGERGIGGEDVEEGGGMEGKGKGEEEIRRCEGEVD